MESNLHQRKKSEQSPSSDFKMSEKKPLESILAPNEWQKKLAAFLKSLGPALEAAGKMLNVAAPYAEKAWVQGKLLWEKAQPYHPDDLVYVLWGLMMAFFGGTYFMFFAAVEAYKLCGWDKTVKHLRILWAEYGRAKEASAEDDKIDADNDGVADVLQISKKELFTRKFGVALKSCNPERVNNALIGIWTGFMGVVATLRIEFAQTITMGTVIGDVFTKVGLRVAGPIIQSALPQEYSKWCPMMISIICRSIGISIAWVVQRLISAFYSAIRGAQIFAKGLLHYAGVMGYVSASAKIDESSAIFTAVVACVACMGFLFQLNNGMSVPFPLNVLFLPIRIADSFLSYFVGTADLHAASGAQMGAMGAMQ